MTLELHATPEEVMRGVEALRAFCLELRLPEPVAFQLALALEECGSNIVNHALQRDARRVFRATFWHADGAVHVELRDSGPEFDPTRSAGAAGAPGGRDDQVGGWGLQLVRRSVDQMWYLRDGSENVLRLAKNVQAPRGDDAAGAA